MNKVRNDALRIMNKAVEASKPMSAVTEVIETLDLNSNVYIVAIGKAAWTMAKASSDALGDRIIKGVVITKYEHSEGSIPNIDIIEASHPVPDENSLIGASRALEMTANLSSADHVLFLVSGGGSSLFERPVDGVSLYDIADITGQLLACGANIKEINAIRKGLSSVKGGRFALNTSAHITTIVLSDVIGNDLSSIASGPTVSDQTTGEEALRIVERYGIELEQSVEEALRLKQATEVKGGEYYICGSVDRLCKEALTEAEKMGYKALLLTTQLDCEAREAGRFIGSIAREAALGKETNGSVPMPLALICGGETVVNIRGTGKGGRNQETALSAALSIEGIADIAFVSIGSDGTDGPTEAAGGIVDGYSAERMRNTGRIPEVDLDENNAYYALQSSDDLIVTGPTGTNVNDLIVLLYQGGLK